MPPRRVYNNEKNNKSQTLASFLDILYICTIIVSGSYIYKFSGLINSESCMFVTHSEPTASTKNAVSIGMCRFNNRLNSLHDGYCWTVSDVQIARSMLQTCRCLILGLELVGFTSSILNHCNFNIRGRPFSLSDALYRVDMV